MSRYPLAGFVTLWSVLFIPALSFGQRIPEPVRFQYPVKFICALPGVDTTGAVVPGAYATAINIHNPTSDTVVFRKKFALALPNDVPGRVSPFARSVLGPDQAVEINCPEIWRRTRTRGFAKGFAVIETDVGLDVVAVYTAAGAQKQVETLQVERIFPRRDVGCPDLVVDTIFKPTWEHDNRRSVIKASIKNVGTAAAGPSFARVVDPSTITPTTGYPYDAVALTPGLSPGESATVAFYLPYWVYNPDATLEVTADYKNDITECREDNNTKQFKDIG